MSFSSTLLNSRLIVNKNVFVFLLLSVLYYFFIFQHSAQAVTNAYKQNPNTLHTIF